MTGYQKAKILVGAAQMQQIMALAPHLPQAELHYAPDSNVLLQMAHTAKPDVVVLYHDLPTLVALWEVVGMLRGQGDLSGTLFLAVGFDQVGHMLTAGADATLPAALSSPEVVAQQLDNLLRRARNIKTAQEHSVQLIAKLADWEHEERVRDQLVHMLVHDLKNPITAILGLLELVRSDPRLAADLEELVRLSQEEAQHLLHLSVNMLDVRKIQAGKMNLKPALLFAPMLLEIIQKAQGDVGSGLSERHLSVQVPPNLTPVQVDPEILRRIFANLLSNALKHTRAGGKIAVVVRELTDYLQFSVSDDGEGIPAEDIPNLFAAFEQSRLTLHGRFDTGMGLAFCKLAVEAHGGRIWVDSVRGKGSTFFFTLPLDQPDDDDDDDVELLI